MNQDQFAELIRTANYAAATARQLDQRYGSIEKGFRQMEELLGRIQVQSRYGDPGIQRVENIPGRRIPFDLLVDIALPSGTVSPRQGDITISQEGPFVAVARSFHLTSALEVTYTNPETAAVARFNGRSYGRFRAIHSAWDLGDGRPIFATTQAEAFPGTGAPHWISPSNASPFRSMQGDFRVKFENAGSSFPRSNLTVPSTMWTEQINSPFKLGALDVFERGEVLSFTIQPLHANNPEAGNVAAFAAGNPLYPFLAGQYDAVEGIVDAVDVDATSDPVSRDAAAVATIGFHGYRIIQQPSISGGM